MLVVERPGPRTTVQDLGRFGFGHVGVPSCGAADVFSLRLANALVGNDEGAAGLETTLAGPVLRFDSPAVVALTGAVAPIELDGEALAMGVAVAVPAGGRLSVGTARAGVRTYLAVSGGIGVPETMGSRSTDTLCGLGGRVLVGGDRLPIGRSVHWGGLPGRRLPGELLGYPLAADSRALRMVVGPRDDWFVPDALDVLTGSSYTVTPRSDRVGVRLTGEPLRWREVGCELPPEAVATGALQVPPDGQPIVLLADHAPTGGYPVIGVVATADLPLAAQARPGARLRFQVVTPEEARKALSIWKRPRETR